jgi:ubiquinone/menaquinone biosynthesis C-methylase UbiE
MELTEIYGMFDEDKRLTQSKSDSIEFLTITHYLDKYLKPGMKICDIGAGTGAYSLRLAEKGYEVSAVEPVLRHVDILKSRICPGMKLEAYNANALDLSCFPDQSFDLVLCMGPLYHLPDQDGKARCVVEAKRICKPGGILFFAYISNDMVFVTETMLYNPDFLGSAKCYDQGSFRLAGEPFHFMTVEDMELLAKNAGLSKEAHFAAEGLAELLSDKINAFSDEQFSCWMKFHLYACEKKELLGFSNHIVFIAAKS